MKTAVKGSLIFFLLLFISGCAAKQPVMPPAPILLPTEPVTIKEIEKVRSQPTPVQEILAAVEEEEPAEPVVPTGQVFAKTIFEGLVKTSYVQLEIVDTTDPQKSFQLYIGDKERQKNFPWKVQKVMPGYFYIELPVGVYKIKSISIPVGQENAVEPMDVIFQVQEGVTVYLGTLKVIGTKEKIKLGGVPLIRPGFEYRIEFSHDRQEAVTEFKARFPDLDPNLAVGLFRINRVDNISSP